MSNNSFIIPSLWELRNSISHILYYNTNIDEVISEEHPVCFKETKKGLTIKICKNKLYNKVSHYSRYKLLFEVLNSLENNTKDDLSSSKKNQLGELLQTYKKELKHLSTQLKSMKEALSDKEKSKLTSLNMYWIQQAKINLKDTQQKFEKIQKLKHLIDEQNDAILSIYELLHPETYRIKKNDLSKCLFSNKDIFQYKEFELTQRHEQCEIKANNKFEIFIKEERVLNIEYNLIKEDLLIFLQKPISEINILQKFGYLLAKIQTHSCEEKAEFPDKSTIPLLFSLRNALLLDDRIETEYGDKYLNVGNGIFIKIQVRKNYQNHSPLIACIEENKKFYFVKDIFSGYTSSGFILPLGLYIRTKAFIYEIHYDANALILNSQNMNFSQSISDSKLVDEEKEQEDLDF